MCRGDCVWGFFWQLDVRDDCLCGEERGSWWKAYLCSWFAKDSVLCSLPLQQLQLSAEALARSFLSSLMGSGNSLYSSTSVSWAGRERDRLVSPGSGRLPSSARADGGHGHGAGPAVK